MKKFKTLAAVALAAAVSAVAFAACTKNDDAGTGGLKGSFNIANYAHPLDSEYAKNHLSDYSNTSYVNKAYTYAAEKNYASISTISYSDFVTARVETTDQLTGKTVTSYTLYDIKNDKELITGLEYGVNWHRAYGSHYTITYYDLPRTEKYAVDPGGIYVTGGTVYQFAGPDGTLITEELLESSFDLNFTSETSYKDENGIWLEFFKISYTPSSGGAEVVKYFCYSENNGEMSWEEVSRDALEAPQLDDDSDYKAGTQLGLTKQKIITSADYPSHNYEGIEYTVEGGLTKTYTYYKNGGKLSSIGVTQGDIIGYAGDYVYYIEAELVSVDATDGYNLEVNTGSTVIKTNARLYRYDFIHGKDLKEVSMGDYVVLDAQMLYNYSTGKFDALVAQACKKVNGVAVASSNYSLIVINEKGEVAADLSGTNLGNLSSFNVYKLNENRYLTGSYILDGKCNTIAQSPYSVTVWAEKSLLRCSNNMFLDYDGKVVIEPISGTFRFYGDAACADYDNKIYSIANPSGVELKDVISVDESKGEWAYIESGVIVKQTSVQYAGIIGKAYTYTIYDLTGKQLGSIKNTTFSTLSLSTMSGKLVASGITVLTNPPASAETRQVSLIIR